MEEQCVSYMQKNLSSMFVTEHLNIRGLYKPDIIQRNKQAGIANPKMLVA